MFDAFLKWLGPKERVEMPEAQRREISQAAESFFRANFPGTAEANGGCYATVWADEETRFVVAMNTLAPGHIRFFAVEKQTLAVRPVEDELRYRPRSII